ncbi:MAG: hypothetical protein EBS23_03880 [Betaproteobacteria bacterium]|nr:hypothetical protein [Betaproteobacteria bacterium]
MPSTHPPVAAHPPSADSASATLVVATADARALLHDWPVLARRLATADHRREDHLALEDWLLAIHQMPTAAEPALTAQALGLSGRGHGWLAVDAVALTVSRDRLVGLPQAAEDADDAARLVDDVLGQMPVIGTPYADGSRRLLDLDAPADARFAPLWRIAGRPLDDHLPQGPRGAEWRRWLTEAQMVLHEHPLNATREARGLRPLNALWLAGGEAAAPAPGACPLQLHGNHPLARLLLDAAPPSAGAPPANLAVWLHQPGSPPPAAVDALSRRANFELRILEPSGQQRYRRRGWHAVRLWRKALPTLCPVAPA